MTAREAAEALGVDYAQLASWRSAKKGPAFTKRADGRIFYRRTDLVDWTAARGAADEEKARSAEADRIHRKRIEVRDREMNDGHEFTGWRPGQKALRRGQGRRHRAHRTR